MKRTKKRWGKLLLGMMALGSCLNLSAQVQHAQTDSVSIISLMEQVEKATSYKIYTDISMPFMVKKPEGAASLDHLKNCKAY